MQLLTATRTVALIVAFALPMVASASSLERRGSIGLGDTCNDTNRTCQSKYVCARLNDNSGPYCLEPRKLHQPCNYDRTTCIDGSRCDATRITYNGYCRPQTGHQKRSPYVEYVGLGDTCNHKTRLCNSGRTCATLTDGSGPYCLDAKKPGEACNFDRTTCTGGTRCSATRISYTGICSPPTTYRKRSPYVEYVGLGDTCNHTTRLCNSGRTCATLTDGSGPYCLDAKKPGEACNFDRTTCTGGTRCSATRISYTGVCSPPTTYRKRSPYVEYVGLGDTCNHTTRLCNSGRKCATLTDGSGPYCLDAKKLGEKCNFDRTTCINSRCDATRVTYNGVCRA
ncbi:hypothetical protein THASP1DRAFT_28285 [Thamnocephalis sphaerospora]|uniref:Dickkopf N-terminal cysteine-rich domain-containing protein n=1 Tax=Thamnocephalis sphaerospora TaxID=78915 RepID=A0A4P9XWE7_9FUNG|nr:hypothetical protein THASP1DRAFT_28285 [Thamnocephalis sphaerospora]|eukprot:RKP09921.1 hypothetical protein THASP1DRAFT_28285 [Thamnocephalis sphaerospora]